MASTTSTPSRIRYNAQDGRRRHGKLLSIKSYSSRDPLALKNFVVGVEICSFLAWKHVQERNGVVISSLPDRLEGCDFDWSLELRDDQSSAQQGVRELVAATSGRKRKRQERNLLTSFNIINYTAPVPQDTTISDSFSQPTTPTIIHDQEDDEPQDDNDDDDWQFPFALVGPTRSSVALPVSILASAHELPTVSGAATSAVLDDSPSFARTIPTNAADARAIMVYFKNIGATHCATLYSQDAWGRTYHQDLQTQAKKAGVTMVGFGYRVGDEDDIKEQLRLLKESGMRYVYAIIKFDWELILETAYDLGIVGTPTHVWIGAESDWTDEGLKVPRNNTRLANALHGIGSLSLHIPQYPRLNDALEDFLNNTELQQEYVSLHPEAHIFDDYSFADQVHPRTATVYHQMFYDATYALGLAACQTPGLFTGPELYQTLVNLEFEGVTGNPISFDPKTGTRSPDTVRFRIDNVVLSDSRSDAQFVRFESQLAAVVVHGRVEPTAHRFVYHDNTTLAPPAIPLLEHDYNLVPTGVRAIGWVLGATVVVFSLGTMLWTWKYRRAFVVRASQPEFLWQICLGTLLLGAAIVPLSLAQGEEESRGQDAACMASLWMMVLGFVTALAALWSKTWRMNQVMRSGMELKRIQVSVTDAMRPFVALMATNVALLTAWTLLSPLKYVRSEGNDYDIYGRSLESYGQCRPSQDSNASILYFLVPLLFVDGMGVLTAAYQGYLARKLPTEFSESYYLALSMGCLVETLALGGPILFAASSSPTSFYLVLSFLLWMTSTTILLPVFVPKYLNRKAQRLNVLQSTVNMYRKKNATGSSQLAVTSTLPRRGRMSVVRKQSESTLDTRPSWQKSQPFASSKALGPPNSNHNNPRTPAFSSWGGMDLSHVAAPEVQNSKRSPAVLPSTDSWGGINLSHVAPTSQCEHEDTSGDVGHSQPLSHRSAPFGSTPLEAIPSEGEVFEDDDSLPEL